MDSFKDKQDQLKKETKLAQKLLFKLQKIVKKNN